MAIKPATLRCENCSGTGLVARAAAPYQNQYQRYETCSKCGGSGEVLAHPPQRNPREPGYIADRIRKA